MNDSFINDFDQNFLMTKFLNSTRRSSRQGKHNRFDKDFLSVSSLLNSVKRPTEVKDKRQVIVDKAFAMTHKAITNGKEFKQVVSVIRQVEQLNTNIPFVKEAQPYLLVVAPKGFLSHMNKLIHACNYYIDESPLLQLGNIKKMDYIDEDIDMKGILFYDRQGVHSKWNEKENMVGYITNEKEAVTPSKLVTHQLEDIL